MKTCLIAPIPDLDRFVGDRFKHHLLLDHLFELPEWGDAYLEFYRRRGKAGDFITVDNGAKEHGSGSPLPTLLHRAIQVGAREVVVSDVRFQGRVSLDVSTREMSDLAHTWPDLYEAAGKPHLMLVPHGETIIDWRNCLFGLTKVAEEVVKKLDGPQWTIGVPYAYDHLFVGGYLPLVDMAVDHVGEQNVHLLGWPRRLHTLMDVVSHHPNIRSIDSSRPIVYGQHQLIAKNGNYPGRSINYFTVPTPWDCESHVQLNIDTFRDFARDK
jgi:hypothetical protein